MVEIETALCPLCGSGTRRTVWLTRDRLYGLPGDFALVRCTTCDLLYLSPRPIAAHIQVFYPEDYEPFIKQRTDHLPLWQRYSLRYGLWKRCRQVLRYKRGGRLLDLGCGTGQFLAEMKRYGGWDLIGVEPSAKAADFARQMLGLNIYTGDLFSVRFPDSWLDVVTMWDVLEHLYEPVATLQEVGRILKPDGILILRTPSLDSWDAWVFGRYWAGLDSPRHLAIYSRRTIRSLLNRAGFKILILKTGGGSYFVCLLSLHILINETIHKKRLRQLLLSLTQNPLTRLLSAIPLFIADHMGLGSEMLIIAQHESYSSKQGTAND